jgi:NAD(P)-dependent dehydrogenase (short-subunit alcohol dehydrogenase family)
VVALVTGAIRGIGRALREALLQLDVTDADQIRAVAESVSDVELVFSNAGVAFVHGFADEGALEYARREMEVNYFGPLQLVQQLAPRRDVAFAILDGIEAGEPDIFPDP